MTLWKWSRTASSNASADATINWAEGQAPSSVNDSARATMAAVAKYRDDIAGAIVTGGTSTAYTIASYQVFDTVAHLDGAMIAFTPHVTCGATVTLNVDGTGARPLRTGPNVELPSGALIQGTPYVATYNNADGAFYLRGATNSYNVPLGAGFDFWGSTAPNSAFAFAYGQAISRTTYATLFALFGTTFGSGDGSTTFNIPDVRGRVVAALDNMGGSAASPLTSIGSGTALGAAGGEQAHTLSTGEMPAHGHTGTTGGQSADHSHVSNSPFTIGSFAIGGGGPPTSFSNNSGGQLSWSTAGVSNDHTHSFTSNNTGGGGAHNNLQPTILCNYIIRII
jgi:microcystin-dependent protein